jgi:hypothetical protein
MRRRSAMGCGGAEEEAIGKLLRPLKNNKRLRHLSIIASNRSSTPRSRNKRSTVTSFRDSAASDRPRAEAGLLPRPRPAPATDSLDRSKSGAVSFDLLKTEAAHLTFRTKLIRSDAAPQPPAPVFGAIRPDPPQHWKLSRAMTCTSDDGQLDANILVYATLSAPLAKTHWGARSPRTRNADGPSAAVDRRVAVAPAVVLYPSQFALRQ